MGIDGKTLLEALRRAVRASGRFSEVDEIEVEPAPGRSGLGAGGHRVLITFEPTVRLADSDRFTGTVQARFEEIFPGARISETDYEPPKPATGVVEEEKLRIRPAQGPTVVLTVRDLEESLRETGQG